MSICRCCVCVLAHAISQQSTSTFSEFVFILCLFCLQKNATTERLLGSENPKYLSIICALNMENQPQNKIGKYKIDLFY